MPTLLVLISILTLTLSTLYIVYRPPSALISYLQRRWPDVLFHVPTHKKILALTIDDAPSPSTSEIHKILKTYGAKATFFVIGSHIAGREDTLRGLVADGHELANHAMRDEPSFRLPQDGLTRQIKSVEVQINQIYGPVASPPRYFRPGSGFFSAAMRKTLASLDYRLVLGSIYPHDAQVSQWKINATHILSMARPGGIIICHDREWTTPMLRKVLPELTKRGYHIVTVTELLSETA
ncbi:polysaccharide deacetylase [Exophiala viscosa]|uniref:polysaccharide deacetylase n=1 Tax=Exophiala viscosa TaxID=2486360 RepID=UPI00219E1D3B|nr:polysaccharide deacetylase [Exophiala viscosa]